MTDSSDQQLPAQNPTDPSANAAPSPPSSQPQAFPEQAPAPIAPPPAEEGTRKKRPWLVVLLIVAGVMIALGLVACAAMFSALSEAKADTEAIELAEKHFDAGVEHIDDASAGIEESTNRSSDALKAAAADAAKDLKSGQDEIGKATVAAKRLTPSQGRTDYLASLKAMATTFDALQDTLTYLRVLGDLTAKKEQADVLVDSGIDSLNDAIKSGNARRYSAMKKQATSASADFAKAVKLYKKAAALDPSAGLDKAVRYAEKNKQEADVAVRMAKAGKAGRTSAYNAYIDKINALRKQADAVGEPAIVSDRYWAENRLAEFEKKLEAASEHVDDLRKKALEELGY